MDSKITTAVVMAAMLYGSAVYTASADAPKTEKCYGIAKAGKNDCKTAAHACAGKAAKDGDRADYLTMPSGLCAKLKNGTTTASAAPAMKAQNVKAAAAAPAAPQSWWQKLWSKI